MINELLTLKQALAHRQDYIQAGGGNISVKDASKMFIKASGFAFSQITPDQGFAHVDYKRIRGYYASTQPTPTHEAEAHATSHILQSASRARPSMETGFHAFMDGAVIHTHPVLPNILLCSENGNRVLHDLFPFAEIVEAVPPGNRLAHAVHDKVKQKELNTLFLQNHGLIVSGYDAKDALARHEHVNERVKLYLKQKIPVMDFECPKLVETERGFVDDSEYIKELLQNLITEDLKTPLFPDQLVYLGDNYQIIENKSEWNKQSIAFTKNEVLHPKPQSEKEQQKLQAKHDVLVSFLYVLHHTKLLDKPRLLSEEHANFIKEMESEKHRQSL